MQSFWNDSETTSISNDLLALRVYTSQLLGRNPALVLHGGGNTSVKITEKDLFGRDVDVLYVKGSGWDLATIEKPGFSPVRMDTLLQMAELETLTDTDMVKYQRAAMLNPNAPNPSVETILHALIPYTFVDHTHADSVVTLTNSPGGADLIRQVYGDRIVIIPYVMPGFILAKTVYDIMKDKDWSQVDAMILLNHGVFTFADTAREAYEDMINIVTKAETYLEAQGLYTAPTKEQSGQIFSLEQLLPLADLRQAVSQQRGIPTLARLNHHIASVAYSEMADISSIASRGPLTPDHSIRTKRVPMVVENDDPAASAAAYAAEYTAYYQRHVRNETMLDPAPRWAVWPSRGTISLGTNVKECVIIENISNHTLNAIQTAEKMGGWRPLGEKDIFDVEYWELEQAKLKRGGSKPPFNGHVAVVSGAAHGIGRACATHLSTLGAAVLALDIDPAVSEIASTTIMPLVCDVTDTAALENALAQAIQTFGGIDIVVSNVGFFPASQSIESIESLMWQKALDVNLTSHQLLWQKCIPFLKRSLNPSINVIASKNVPAPGPNASAYSVTKAGLTQLARVAALELGQFGIRVNTLHPNGVFDTKLWTSELLEKRAASYGITVDQYKRNNILNVEVTSQDVADMVAQLAGPAFAKTTGAQIPLDGGNNRVI